MIDAEQIVSLYRTRRQHRQPMLDKRLEVLAQYNGDTQVVLPELDQAEKPAVANLLNIGLDQFAQRIASVLPDPQYPSLRPGFAKWDEKARKSRLANLGWWRMNRLDLLEYKRARYLLAYAGAPVTIHPVSTSPSDHRRIPFWRVRSPLNAFPAVPDSDLDMEPTDYIVCHRYPLGWLTDRYPAETAVLYKGKEGSVDRDKTFEVLEYNDADETVLVAVGAQRDRESTGWQEQDMGSAQCVELSRVPNKAGVCLMVWPGRIVLDRPIGQFDSMLHLFSGMAKMAALEQISIFRSIFPEQWLVSHPNAPTRPKIIREAEPNQGVIGQVENGIIQVTTLNPGAQVPTALDRSERAMRLAGNIPAEFGSESPTNVRTARRGSAVLSSGVDMPLQEYQTILAASKDAENARAVAVMKAYYGTKPSMFFLSRDGKVAEHEGVDTYIPNDTFVVDHSEAKYSFPGSDSSSIPIEIGQRVGTGEMSLQTAREMDPVISDPIAERDRVEEEGLVKSLMAGIEQMASQGGMDPVVIAKIIARKKETHEDFADVYVAIHSEMQAEQAAQQANQPPPGAPPAPGAMPGAAAPPGGQPTIPPPAPGQQNLADIVSTLHPANAAPAPAPA